MSQVTLSPASRQRYLVRGHGLQDAFVADGGNAASALALATWLIGRRYDLAPATYRIYRCSVRELAREGGFVDAADALALLDADARSQPPTNVRRHRPRRTSALKEKRIRAEDLDRLEVFLRVFSRSARAGSLRDWLQAGILTGLRPVEWASAKVVESADGPELEVRSAKSTNGRSTGPVRHLGLQSLSAAQVEVVRRHADRGRRWQAESIYAREQEAHASLLADVVARIWPRGDRHISLYSARHQAIAGWKAALPREAVSALAGHAVVETATQAYGRRSSAWGPDRALPVPVPAPDEVGIVRGYVGRRVWHGMRPAKGVADPVDGGNMVEDCLAPLHGSHVTPMAVAGNASYQACNDSCQMR